MRLLNAFPVVAAVAMMAACATGEATFSAQEIVEHDLSSESLAKRDGQTIVKASVGEIAAHPEAWSGKWVALEGVLAYRTIESRLYSDAAAAAKGWSYDPNGVGIQMSEVVEPTAIDLDMSTVTVVGRVDVSCIVAHRAATAATNDNRIVWASGFCHTSDGPHLDLARVQAIRSYQ